MSYSPRDITFPSAHHSPSTVNKNAKLFVMGTVKLNSVRVVPRQYFVGLLFPLSLCSHFDSPFVLSGFRQHNTLLIMPGIRQSLLEILRYNTIEKAVNAPACPISRKNHTLPVRLITRGTAYAGLRSKSTTVHIAFAILYLIH